MRSYALQKVKSREALWALWLLMMLYLCRDSLYSNVVIGFVLSYLCQAALFAAGCAILLWRNKGCLKELISDKRILFSACIAVVLLLPMVAKRDWQLMYFSVLFAVVYSVLVSMLIDMKTLARMYVIVLGILAVFSVLNAYCLRFYADAGVAVPPIILNSMGVRYYNFGLSAVYVDWLKWRNLGIFREPGVYQFFLILALYLNNDVCDWANRFEYWALNIILGFTMLTTLAYGGIVEMAILIVVVFFEKGWYRNRNAQLIAVGFILTLVIAYNVIHWLDGPLWGEIWMLKHKLSRGGDSVTDRVGSIVVNLDLFLKSPIVGAKVRDILYHPAIFNNTSSSTIIMAMFGLLGATLHIGAWLAMTWKKNRNVLFNLLFALILSMGFNSENLVADFFLWLFPIMAVCEKLLPRIERKKFKK